jgi:hypothetical protein
MRGLDFEEFQRYASGTPADEEVTGPSGRRSNRQTCTYVLGRLVATTTELWSEDHAWQREETWTSARHLPLRLLPLPRSTSRRSISFTRPDPILETE